MRPNHGTILAAITALTLAACDSDDTLTPRELIPGPVDTAGDGGDDGGSTTDAEAETPFEDGGPQICPIVADEVQFAVPETLDDLVSPTEAALSVATKCPMAGVGNAKYVDYRCDYIPWDGTSFLYCKSWCDCTVDYASPCNPPHADCGGTWTKTITHELRVGVAMWGQTQCQLIGGLQCRAHMQDIADKCAQLCEYHAPKRTVDCPDCPK